MSIYSIVVLVLVLACSHFPLIVEAEDDEDELSAGYLLLASISLATSTAASMQRRSPICEVCGCSSCPEGYKVGTPEGVIPLPSSDQLPVGLTEVPCSLLDFAGSSGQIAEVDCNDDLRLIPELRTICGCPDLPANATTTVAGESVKAVGSDGQFGTDGDSDPIAVVSQGKSKKIGKKEKDKEKTEKERLYKTSEDEKSAEGKTTDKIYQAADNSEKSKTSKTSSKGGKGKADKDSDEDERTDETGKDGQFGTDGRKRRQLTLRVSK